MQCKVKHAAMSQNQVSSLDQMNDMYRVIAGVLTNHMQQD